MRPRLALLLTCLGGVGCSPEAASLQPFTVSVNVVGSATIALDRLRLVAVLEGDDPGELAIGPDVTVTATGTPVQLELRSPEGFEVEVESQPLYVQLTDDGWGVQASRVRFVAYLDVDGSGDYQGGESLLGVDQPVGVDPYGQGVAWLADPEAQLAALPAAAIDAFYRATDDAYTPFLPFMVGSTFMADESGLAIEVDVARHTIVNADLACRGSLYYGVDPPTEVLLWVDRSLDAQTLCGLEIGDCRPVDTSTLTPPALPDPALEALNPFVDTHAQCRQRGGVQVLVVEEARLRCDPTSCLCVNVDSVVAVATATTATPPWWPCGDTVEFCPSSLPLYRVDPACFPPPEDEGG